MNKELVGALFPEAIERINAGKCAFCAKDIEKTEFRDADSRKEFTISGLCQDCQDDVFGV